MRKVWDDGVPKRFYAPLWPDPRPTGTDLFQARIKLGATQFQFAEWLGISDSQYRLWEKADSTPIPHPCIARTVDYIVRIPQKDLDYGREIKRDLSSYPRSKER